MRSVWSGNKTENTCHINRLVEARFAPDRTVHFVAFKFDVEFNLPHEFNDEELTWHD
jgi:hypothetical protein